MGYDETCKGKGDSCVAPEDDVNLMQLHAQVQKHASKHSKRTKPDMGKILASFEAEEGPVALQELLRGVMTLPVLKTEEAMLGAVHAQPQLQHLAKRYPHFLRTLGIFEDAKAVQEIKAAAFKKHQSPMKMQGRQSSASAPVSRMPADIQLLGKHLKGKRNTTVVTLFYWMQGWGCSTNFTYIANPAEEGTMAGEVPFFGPDCEGYPWIGDLAFAPDANGAYYVKGNSSNVDGTWKTTYTMNFGTESETEELLELGSGAMGGEFDIPAQTYTFIEYSGEWPDYTWALMSADLQSKMVTPLMNITGCLWPYQVVAVPATGDLVWTCSKDWSKDDDTSKIMKYSSGGGTEILAESEDYFGYLTTSGSNVFYSMWNSTDYRQDLYTCAIEDCKATMVAKLPQNSGYGFFITESGTFISSAYVKWSGSGSIYNVTASTDFGNGQSSLLFETSDYPNMLQMIELEVPTEPDVPLPADPDDS